MRSIPPGSRLVGDLERRLAKAYARLGARGESVLLAVSGGADSTALLLASVAVAGATQLRLEVATLDHGARPRSAQETSAVESLAAAQGLAAHMRRLDIPAGPGFEGRARERRYEALEAIRLERQLQWIATAHTASDQAETLLMRLARGSALRGAGGVRERRRVVLRPMLDWTRAEVVAYLDARGQGYWEDPMNEDPRFLRTRIRREALPALHAAAGYDVTSKLAHFALLAADDNALLDAWAETSRGRLSLPDGSLDAAGVRALALPLRRRLLSAHLRSSLVSPDFEVVEASLALLSGGPEVPLPGDRTLRLRRGRLLLAVNPPRRSEGW